MAHRFRDPAPSTPNGPAELGGHDHYHRFLRRLFGPQVRSASRSQGHLDRTTASAGLCCRANSLRSNQPNLCGMMWLKGPASVVTALALTTSPLGTRFGTALLPAWKIWSTADAPPLLVASASRRRLGTKLSSYEANSSVKPMPFGRTWLHPVITRPTPFTRRR